MRIRDTLDVGESILRSTINSRSPDDDKKGEISEKITDLAREAERVIAHLRSDADKPEVIGGGDVVPQRLDFIIRQIKEEVERVQKMASLISDDIEKIGWHSLILEMMNPLSSELIVAAPFTSRLAEVLKAQKPKVMHDVTALLGTDKIQDATDRQTVEAALRFVENSDGGSRRFLKHTADIGQVIGDYASQGLDVPSALDALNAYLLAFQCTSHIFFMERAFDSGTTESGGAKYAMKCAVQDANILSDGYKDRTFIDAVKDIQEKARKINQ